MNFKLRNIILLSMVSFFISLSPSLEARTPYTTTIPSRHKIPSYGGTLVWGSTNPPVTINPILTQHSVSAGLLALIFDSLVRIDSMGQIVSGLANAWDVSEDGLVYIFKLHKGVYFHDGHEVSAEDVKFTYDMISDPKNQSPWRMSSEIIKEWEVIDPYTLKMTLNRPFKPILYKLVREIAPKHLLQDQDIHHILFNETPIGTGPFQFKRWDKETGEIELTANLNYFEGRPYLDRILIKIYSDNSALWSAMMRHEVDLILHLNKEDYQIVKDDASFRAYQIPWEAYSAILYNLKDSILFDREVRKAIAHGINVDALMDVISAGGIRSRGPFHPQSMGFDPSVEVLEYDPVKARMALMHRGWYDRDGDGIAERAGKKLEIQLLVDGRIDYYKKMGKIIRQQLAEIGIRVELQIYEDERMLTQEYLEQFRPQAWLRYFQGLGNDADEAVTSWYSSSHQFGRLWDYKNIEVDRLFELGRSVADDLGRAQVYQEIHKRIYDHQPASFLFFPVTYHAVSVKFQNTEDFFSRYMPVFTIKDWYTNDLFDLVSGSNPEQF